MKQLTKNKGGRIRMGFQTWVIIILLGLSYYQYSNPEKANELVSPIWGPVQSFIDGNNPLQNNNTENNAAVVCPDISEPVCGDNGENYKNSCEAALDGILVVTPGAC